VRNRFAVSCLISLTFFVVTTPLLAHHGNAAYDYEKTVTIKGTVTEWTFANPHSWLKLDATDDKGNVQHWILEGYGASVEGGDSEWHKTTLKPGDAVTVDIMPTKNGAAVGRIRRVVLADGKVINGVRSSTKNDVATPKKRPTDPGADDAR
jgi:hypothetical protein